MKISFFRPLYRFLPDKLYLQLRFHRNLGKWINWKNPQTFNEKLQWLKIYNRNPLYTTLVDKYAVKKWVADKIGEQYVIPTLGVWNSFDEIDFDKLPNQFVLKTTHDSGGVVICRDKKTFNKEAAREKLTESLKRNFYYQGREWPYKNVPPRIIAEKYMEDPKQPELLDYKFYVFNGAPKYIAVCQGMSNHATAHMSYMKLDWTFAPFTRTNYPPFENIPPRPVWLKDMDRIARIFAENIPFLRVDFYEVNGQVKIGELTFTPSSGWTPFNPTEWDKKIGDWLTLPTKE